MLVLTRRISESIRIGDDIVVTVVQIAPGKVRIGIEAPSGCMILREELIERAAGRPNSAPRLSSPAARLSADPLPSNPQMDLPTG
jgi:carbon storage regulator CsrA